MTGQRREKVAREWLELASHDWETARFLAEQGDYHPEVVGMLIQQAVEKYLKGYLISRGWALEKTHDLERLCKLASGYDKGFRVFIDSCIEIGDFYLSGRYPPIVGDVLTSEDVGSSMKSAEELIRFIQARMTR
ncbi:MAG: HEPN domain-containing protein [Candidatus Thermoplasmatota archaeon]